MARKCSQELPHISEEEARQILLDAVTYLAGGDQEKMEMLVSYLERPHRVPQTLGEVLGKCESSPAGGCGVRVNP